MDLSSFTALLSPEGGSALSAAAEILGDTPDPLAAATRLRRSFPAGLASAALTQAALRRRAVAKFGADADVMYFTPNGLEQATRHEVAAHRARRVAGARVVDVCCGIGGDFIALARAGCQVTAIDLDPLTAAVARANAAALGLDVDVQVGEAASVDPAAYDVLFADPARRGGGRRTFDPNAYSPPWPVVMDMVARARRAVLKVAPGIAYDFIPGDCEAEWVSWRGEVKEAVLWSGDGEPGVRRATILPSGLTLTAQDVVPDVKDFGAYLYEPDGAAVRAHLVGEVARLVGGWLVDPRIAYIASDTKIATPWAAGYAVEEILPFSLKRLRAALRERNVGAVTIKKRGSAIDVEKLRKDLKLQGDTAAVVLLTRIGERPIAVLAAEISP